MKDGKKINQIFKVISEQTKDVWKGCKGYQKIIWYSEWLFHSQGKGRDRDE